jgi:regulator of cell morphogenesis and NO signaling
MTTQQSLREIALAQPEATGVFLEHGLDFCCGGTRSLAEACEEKGLEPITIINEIQAGAFEPDSLAQIAAEPLREITKFIEKHYHARLRAHISELIVMAQKVEQKHKSKASCPNGLAKLLQGMQESVLEHLAKEEQVLFPMIRAGYGGSMKSAIQTMERERTDNGETLRQLREMTNGFTPPPEACVTWQILCTRLALFSDELMQHIHLENNILFPRALCE